MSENSSRSRPAARSAHSEAYWNAIKYVIVGLAALMFVALALAVIILLRGLPWT